MYKDFREYLSLLEENHLLYRVQKEVDPAWEIGAILRQIMVGLPESRRYGVLFENVMGCKFKAAIGVVGMSRKIVEVGLGVSYEKRLALGVNALENPIEPILVDSGPCKENILKDDSIDLSTIPFITWSAGLDGGPFHTSGAIITKDFRTGKRNVAVYRMNVKGK
ncbi:MAG: UbiD family decarboxylase domain-containing protein, partial [Nitrososphaerales archaeon]